MPEGDSSLGEIVGGEFQRDFISGEHPDAITAEPAGQVGQHDAIVFELYAEQTARKLFQHGSSYFDAVFFTHTLLRELGRHNIGVPAQNRQAAVTLVACRPLGPLVTSNSTLEPSSSVR